MVNRSNNIFTCWDHLFYNMFFSYMGFKHVKYLNEQATEQKAVNCHDIQTVW